MGMRESLRGLVAEMVSRGVRFEVACAEFERIFLEAVIAQHAGNQSAAARDLGMHRNTLSRKLVTTPAASRTVAVRRPRAAS